MNDQYIKWHNSILEIIQNNILCKYIIIYWIIHKELPLSYIENMWQYIYLYITKNAILYSVIHFIYIDKDMVLYV